MEKQLVVNNEVFTFGYRPDNNFWYLGNHEFDIFNLGYTTGITINEINPNWNEIESFLNYISRDFAEMLHKLNTSNERLKIIFKNEFQKIVPELKYEDIFFTLCNIEYLGLDESKSGFKYILNFNVESKSDRDFFTYDSWNTKFENNLLIDAYKS